MNAIQMVSATEDHDVTIMDNAALMVLARVGLVCGPVEAIDVQMQGRIAIVRVEPIADPDPYLPIPQVDAGPTAWARLREFYHILTRLCDTQLSQRLHREVHTEAIAMIPRVVGAFARYLTPEEIVGFERLLAVGLIGAPKIRFSS